MKNGLPFILMSLFISLSAFAATHTDHAYAHVLNGIPLNKACVTPTHVQSIDGVKVCTERTPVVDGNAENSTVDYICTKWATEVLSYSRTYKVEKCVRFTTSPNGYPGCGKTELRNEVMPKTINIRTWIENGDYNTFPGKTVKFTFPDCK